MRNLEETNLTEEKKYPYLARFLQARGRLKIGRNLPLESMPFAELTMTYADGNSLAKPTSSKEFKTLDDLLKALDRSAKGYFEKSE